MSQYKAVLRVAPSSFFYYLFYFVYIYFFLFICVQLLPDEQFGKHKVRLKEEDKSLNKKVFIRGAQTKWIKKGCCLIPLLHKWRVTPRASNILINISHKYFALSCLFNILFLVCFLHREYLVSLIMLLLLFITLIVWYKAVNAWYVILPPKTEDEIIQLKKEFDHAHSDEDAELRNEKWESKKHQLLKKPLDINFVEVIVLHIPLSFYLGLVSFLVIIISGYFTLLFVGIGCKTGCLNIGWDMAQWYDEGWAWAMISLVSLIIIGLSFKQQDPILPLSFSFGPLGVFYQNTIGTCTWSTTSGIAIRKPSSLNPNQLIKSVTPLVGLPELYQRGGISGGRLHWFWNLTDDTGKQVNDYDWSYVPQPNDKKTSSTNNDGESGSETNEDDKKLAAYWCKKAIKQGHNNFSPPDVATKLEPWAFRYQDGKPLTYYGKYFFCERY